MMQGSHGRQMCVALLLAGIALAPAPTRAEGTAALEVITNPDHSDVALDRTLLRSLFTMRLREWPDGRPVRVFVMPDDDPMHDEFSREVLGTYPYVLRGAWDRQVFTGTGFAPIVVRSEEEMRRKVMNTPGSIGYARLSPRSSSQELLVTLWTASSGVDP